MNTIQKIGIMLMGCFATTLHIQGQPYPYYNEQVNNQAKQLLSQMSLEEKVGQMAQITLDVIGQGNNRYESKIPFLMDQESANKAIVKYGVGSVLNASMNRALTLEQWNKVISQIQSVAQHTRLKIPVLYGVDAIHGTTYTAGATFFPQQIGQAATFNTALVKQAAAITAYETKASAIVWNFSPVLDLGRDPRNARQWETYGEDPYLCGIMGAVAVKGYEGENNQVGSKDNLAACVKHYLGYQVAFSGKDRTPAYIPYHTLREYHLAPFKQAIHAGVHSIMVNSSMINDMPVHASYDLLTTLLKGELQFDGLVVTDWGDIENLYTRDRIARNHKEAIMLAINAGIDMSMIPYEYERFCDNLVALVKEGKVSMHRIDDAVLRILRVKIATNLWNVPVPNYKDYSNFGSQAHKQAAYQTAVESITLLKNENNILPLKKGIKIFVTGPNSNSMRTLNGGWSYSWQGEKVEEFTKAYNTILEAMQSTFGKDNILEQEGVSYKMKGAYHQDSIHKLPEAMAKAKQADVIVLCLGENSYTEKPGDLTDLNLSDNQLQYALALAKLNKPIVLVLNEGRPRIFSKIEPVVKAVVQTYLPGNYGADALADILVGKENPSGKLPYTYPKHSESLLVYYHKPSEGKLSTAGVYDYSGDASPQYIFGSGLSYTSFEYANLKTDKENYRLTDTIQIVVDITNTGRREGKESVLLYSSQPFAKYTPDVRRLRRFEKVNIQPQQTQPVKFTLAVAELGYISPDYNTQTTEISDYMLMIGNQKTKISIVQ